MVMFHEKLHSEYFEYLKEIDIVRHKKMWKT